MEKIIVLIILSGVLSGCLENSSMTFNPGTTYLFHGKNFSYAFYNEDAGLITEPLLNLSSEALRRKVSGYCPITDIYVMSHGWNFPATEAVANYHGYMKLIESLLPTKKEKEKEKIIERLLATKKEKKCKFQPYFIFVAWVSTVRPLSDLASGVLPFQLDKIITPITDSIDKGPLHIATAWKQSVVATEIAIGKQSVNSYLDKEWFKAEFDLDGTKNRKSPNFGRDLPVSALIYQLIRDIKDTHPDDDDDQNLYLDDTTKIHLVGHSYGAKLVALGGMEALRRRLLDDEDCTPDNIEQNSFCHRLYYGSPIISPPGFSGDNAPNPWLSHDQNMSKDIDRILQSQGYSPIRSMVLFNPAMTASAFSYPIELVHLDSISESGGGYLAYTSQLRLIPRKAIVYSKSDYPNGLLFSLRDLVMNGQVSQGFHSWTSGLQLPAFKKEYGKIPPVIETPLPDKFDKFLGHSWNTSLGVGDWLIDVALGSFSVAYTTVYGTVLNGLNFGENLFKDYWYHVNKHKLFGTLDADIEKFPFPETPLVLAGNTLDYFLPIYPWFWQRYENEMGFYRGSRVGLGKTGLTRNAIGRIDKNSETIIGETSLSVGAMNEFYTPKCRRYDEKLAFHNLTTSISDENHPKKLDSTSRDAQGIENHFYSFDASNVYDSKSPFSGSHGDLRSTDEIEITVQTEGGIEKIKQAKRIFTQNFIYNFTKTDFTKELVKTETAQKNKCTDI